MKSKITKKQLAVFGIALFAALLLLFVSVMRAYQFTGSTWRRTARIQRLFSVDVDEESAGHGQDIVVVAHRGMGLQLLDKNGDPQVGECVGNTIEAIEKAIHLKADWIEIDVRRSKDGILYLFHDEDVRARTDADVHWKNRDSYAFDSFPAKEIDKLCVRNAEGEAIPRLESVLKMFGKTQVKFILDLKQPISIDELERIIDENVEGKEQIMLFGYREVLMPLQGSGYKLGYTPGFYRNFNFCRFPLGHQFLLDDCKDLKCGYLIVPAVFLSPSLIRDAHDQHVKVWGYALDEQDLTTILNRNIDGVIVDDPKQAFSVLEKNKSALPVGIPGQDAKSD